MYKHWAKYGYVLKKDRDLKKFLIVILSFMFVIQYAFLFSIIINDFPLQNKKELQICVIPFGFYVFLIDRCIERTKNYYINLK